MIAESLTTLFKVLDALTEALSAVMRADKEETINPFISQLSDLPCPIYPNHILSKMIK